MGHREDGRQKMVLALEDILTRLKTTERAAEAKEKAAAEAAEAAAAEQARRDEEVNQALAAMDERLGELGESLHRDLSEYLEKNDEKLHTGLTETSRILDVKVEQMTEVVREQMEQLDRSTSTAQEELRQQIETIDESHQAREALVQDHAAVHSKFEEHHKQAADTHAKFEELHSTADQRLGSVQEQVSVMLERLEQVDAAHQATASTVAAHAEAHGESKDHHRKVSESHAALAEQHAATTSEAARLTAELSQLASSAEQSQSRLEELERKMAADVQRVEAAVAEKADGAAVESVRETLRTDFAAVTETVRQAEESSFERTQTWLQSVVPPEDFGRLQKDVVLLHGEMAMVCDAATEIKQTKVEIDSLASGVQENVCALTDQVDQMEVQMETHLASARDVMAGLEENAAEDKARDERLRELESSTADAVADLRSFAERTMEDVKTSNAQEIEQVKSTTAEVVVSTVASVQNAVTALEEQVDQLHSHQASTDEEVARVRTTLHGLGQRQETAEEAASEIRESAARATSELRESVQLLAAETEEWRQSTGARLEHHETQHQSISALITDAAKSTDAQITSVTEMVTSTFVSIDERRRRERQSRIDAAVTRAVHRMRNKALGNAWAGWRHRVGSQTRAHNLARKAVLRVENREMGRAFAPWLAAARAQQVANAQESEAQFATIHTTLRQQRQSRIDAAVTRAVHRLRHRLLSNAWAGWRHQAGRQKRVKNLARKTILRVEHREVGRAFTPWLAAARARQEVDAQGKIDTYISRLDGALKTRLSTLDETVESKVGRLKQEVSGLIIEQIHEIDQRLSNEVAETVGEKLKALSKRISDSQSQEKQLMDGMREQWMEELEHLEVTMREEFVAVQVRCDRLGRDMGKGSPGTPTSSPGPGQDPAAQNEAVRVLTEQVRQLRAEVRDLRPKRLSSAADSDERSDLLDTSAGGQRELSALKRAQEAEFMGVGAKMLQLQADIDSLRPKAAQDPWSDQVDTIDVAKIRAETQKELQAIRQENEQVLAEVAEMTRSHQTMQDGFGDVRSTVQSLLGTLASVMEVKSEAAMLKQHQDALRSEVLGMHSSLEKTTGGLVTVNAQVAAFSQQVDRVRQDTVADAAKETTKLRQEMQALQSLIGGAVAADIKQIEANLNRMQRAASPSEGLISAVMQLQSDIASIQDAQQSTLTSISDEATRVSRAETELSAIRDAADANTQDVKDMAAEVSRLKASASDFSAAQEQVEVRLAESQATFRLHTSKIGQTQQSVDRLGGSLRSELTAVQHAQAASDKHAEEERTRARQVREEFGGEMKALQQAQREFHTGLAETKSTAEVLQQQQLPALKAELDALRESHEGKHSEASDAHSRFEELHSVATEALEAVQEQVKQVDTAHQATASTVQEHAAAHSVSEKRHFEATEAQARFEELHQATATLVEAHSASHREAADNHSALYQRHSESAAETAGLITDVEQLAGEVGELRSTLDDRIRQMEAALETKADSEALVKSQEDLHEALTAVRGALASAQASAGEQMSAMESKAAMAAEHASEAMSGLESELQVSQQAAETAAESAKEEITRVQAKLLLGMHRMEQCVNESQGRLSATSAELQTAKSAVHELEERVGREDSAVGQYVASLSQKLSWLTEAQNDEDGSPNSTAGFPQALSPPPVPAPTSPPPTPLDFRGEDGSDGDAAPAELPPSMRQSAEQREEMSRQLMTLRLERDMLLQQTDPVRPQHRLLRA